MVYLVLDANSEQAMSLKLELGALTIKKPYFNVLSTLDLFVIARHRQAALVRYDGAVFLKDLGID